MEVDGDSAEGDSDAALLACVNGGWSSANLSDIEVSESLRPVAGSSGEASQLEAFIFDGVACLGSVAEMFGGVTGVSLDWGIPKNGGVNSKPFTLESSELVLGMPRASGWESEDGWESTTWVVMPGNCAGRVLVPLMPLSEVMF